MISAIIFDVFGTLISTSDGSLQATKKILQKTGSNIDAIKFYAEWKLLYKKFCQCENGYLTENEIFSLGLKELYEKYELHSNYTEDVKIMLDSRFNRKAFDDVLPAFEVIREKYKLYLGSNTDNDILTDAMNLNNIKVDDVFTSEILQCYKPDKRFYEYILKEIRLSSDEVLFVGDSLSDDISGPQQLGIRSVLIDRNNTFDKKNTKVKPYIVIKSLIELQKAVL